jgi:hypothetical protein
VSAVAQIGERAAEEERAYAGQIDRPLGSYALLLSTYLAAAGSAAVFIRRRRLPLPRPTPGDLALGAVATFRLSRLITKDSVTSVGRAPFTRFEGAAGDGEVKEEVRGRGLRHAIGELVSCPFCIAQWIATAYVVGLIVAPRATRLGAGVLAVVTGSDGLQFAHHALQRNESGGG